MADSGVQSLSSDWVSILFVWHVAADLILFIVALLTVKTVAKRNKKVLHKSYSISTYKKLWVKPGIITYNL